MWITNNPENGDRLRELGNPTLFAVYSQRITVSLKLQKYFCPYRKQPDRPSVIYKIVYS